MSLRPLTALRHFVTALTLLIVVLFGVEIWLRSTQAPTALIVAGQAPVEDQSLLVPSAVYHHELRRLQQTAHVTEPGSKPIEIRINSLGCRGAEIESLPQVGVRRILLLGDDTICGTHVAETETVAAWSKKFFTQSTGEEVEVINAGVPGYCPLLASLKFQHDLSKLKPDFVVLHIDMTDIADDCCYRSLTLQEGDHSVCSHPTLRLHAKPENPTLQLVRQSATASWLFAKTRQHGPELLSVSRASLSEHQGLLWITDNPPDLRLQIDHALKPIRTLHDSVKQAGGQLLITTSPVLWQVVSADRAPELSRRLGITGKTPFASTFPFELLRSFCQEADIPFCDASPAFRRDKAEKLFSKSAPALSKVGMALYAREIARSLVELTATPRTPAE